MRLRLGGAVIAVGRGVVLTSVCAFALLFAATIYGLSVMFNKPIAGTELYKPTPIDEMLQRIMDDEQYDGPKMIKDVKDHVKDQSRQKAKSTNLVVRPEVKQAQETEMAMGNVVAMKWKQLNEAKKDVVGLNNRPPDSHYNINVTLSDIMSLDRDLPETRPPVCVSMHYETSSLPRCTVIIPFFNEAPTMILRAVHSVLNRSPAHLLDEIILVDDMSFDEPLKAPLQRYLDLLPNVRLVRHNKRSGLIVARMIGARLAKSPVIIFLDAHSEVNVGWLEPLLHLIKLNPKQVLQPLTDGIDKETLAFTASVAYYKGAFSWDLRYTWLKLSDHEQRQTINTGQPFFSPTLVGCAIAVDKDYFFSIGAFDEGMRVWGGENLELAFRTWMCGGEVLTVTCSRVGHVFKQSPNKFDGTEGTKEQTIQRNLMRTADVWMDGTKKFFYATSLVYDYKRFTLDDTERISVKERVKQRESMKCHNFEWYLHNVIPEMNLPTMDSKYFGEIMNVYTRGCWVVTEDYYLGMTYECFEHKIIPKNDFSLTTNGLLRYRDKCAQILAKTPFLFLTECPSDNYEKFGIWSMISKGPSWGMIKVSQVNEQGDTVFWCVAQVTNIMEAHKDEQMPQLMQCNENDMFQIWSFTYALDFDSVSDYLLPYAKRK